MSAGAQYRLREDAAQMERDIDNLTARIEEAEAQIVNLRRRRDEVRFYRAETLAAANVLDNIGFHVEKDAAGQVTVSLDSPPSTETVS